MSVPDAVRRAAAQILGVVRRGPGEVLWTPSTVRIGNALYYWLVADARQRAGLDCKALATDNTREWHNHLPATRALVVEQRAVRMTDRRTVGTFQTFGHDYSSDELDSFIDRVLLDPDGALAPRIETCRHRFDLTINVRRGDYYSVAKWRGEYSFDVVEYVRQTVQDVARAAPIRSIHVVSDDQKWCRVKLAFLNDIAEVSEPQADSGPLDHLAMLAASPRLILANSTFSYWGGYLSTRWSAATGAHGPQGVWAPWFHNRFFPNGGGAIQLDPRWSIVRDIPGGWDG